MADVVLDASAGDVLVAVDEADVEALDLADLCGHGARRPQRVSPPDPMGRQMSSPPKVDGPAESSGVRGGATRPRCRRERRAWRCHPA